MTALIVIPTTGSPLVREAIASALAQDYPHTDALVVADGPEARAKIINDPAWPDSLSVLALPWNVGANGFYGHRIYGAASLLSNADYVTFLDEDNWYAPDHVSTLICCIKDGGLDWSHSLRKIHTANGNYICDDNCESLGNWPSWQGYNLVDTSTYCFKREAAIRLASLWYGGWGQDRVVTAAALKGYRGGVTGRHTLNYRLHAEHPPTPDFFLTGNADMQARYPRGLPWHGGVDVQGEAGPQLLTTGLDNAGRLVSTLGLAV